MFHWVQDAAEKFFASYYKLRDIPLAAGADAASCEIIAHRGNFALDCIENTEESFQRCLASRVWGIEFDIQWTADNVPVVHHDLCAERVFRHPGILRQMTFAELRKALPQVPSLEETVTLFGRKTHLMIEVKGASALSTEQQEILRTKLSPLRAGEDYHLMSLDVHGLDRLHFDDEIKVGIAIVNVREVSRFVLARDWKAFTAPYFLTSDATVEKHLEKNQIVGTGFIPNRSVLCHEINRGVRWLFTNQAEELQRDLNSLCNR